ncbi:hypothetical protein HDU99_004594, partial [Rhizoclosmatium hyalinum]
MTFTVDALSTGVIYELTTNGHRDDAAPPVLQILNVKKMAAATPDTPDRFRVIVSDGYH